MNKQSKQFISSAKNRAIQESVEIKLYDEMFELPSIQKEKYDDPIHRVERAVIDGYMWTCVEGNQQTKNIPGYAKSEKTIKEEEYHNIINAIIARRFADLYDSIHTGNIKKCKGHIEALEMLLSCKPVKKRYKYQHQRYNQFQRLKNACDTLTQDTKKSEQQIKQYYQQQQQHAQQQYIYQYPQYQQYNQQQLQQFQPTPQFNLQAPEFKPKLSY